MTLLYSRYEDIACALMTAGCDTTVEDDCGRNGLSCAIRKGKNIIVHAILDRRVPCSLRHQCRTVIRSYLRSVYGPGISIKNIIRQIPKHELPRSLVSFLAYDA